MSTLSRFILHLCCVSFSERTISLLKQELEAAHAQEQVRALD